MKGLWQSNKMCELSVNQLSVGTDVSQVLSAVALEGLVGFHRSDCIIAFWTTSLRLV